MWVLLGLVWANKRCRKTITSRKLTIWDDSDFRPIKETENLMKKDWFILFYFGKRPAPACLHSGCNNRRTNNFLMLAGLLSRTKAWPGWAGEQAGNRVVSDVKGIILCRKCPRNWCFRWGLVGISWTHQTTTTTVLQLQKGFCLFCLVCLHALWGWNVEISQILGSVGLCFFKYG